MRTDTDEKVKNCSREGNKGNFWQVSEAQSQASVHPGLGFYESPPKPPNKWTNGALDRNKSTMTIGQEGADSPPCCRGLWGALPSSAQLSCLLCVAVEIDSSCSPGLDTPFCPYNVWSDRKQGHPFLGAAWELHLKTPKPQMEHQQRNSQSNPNCFPETQMRGA